MVWDLKYSHKLKWFNKLEETGETIRALNEKPKLYADLALDYQAFKMLNASRQSTMSAAPISMADIYAYMQIFEINNFCTRRQFLYHIKLLDSIYLEFIRES